MKILIKLIALLTLVFHSYISFCQVGQNESTELTGYIKELRGTNSSIKSNLLIKKIIKKGFEFEEIANAIKHGNYYNKKPKTGYIEWEYAIDSLDYTCIIYVPKSYTPGKKYPVSVILHGGVMTFNPQRIKKSLSKNTYNTDSLERIIVNPSGWFQSPWWDKKQVKNLAYILNRLKIEYSIDENNVSLAGISDGGTGLIFQANYNITPWASFRPYIGNPEGLANLAKTPIYIKNLGNRKFLFISTENDKLFPPYLMDTFLERMNDAKNAYNYHLVSGYGHDITWINKYKDTINNYIASNPRNPLPSYIFWQTDNVKYGRNNWVIMDKIYGKHNQINYPAIMPLRSKKQFNSGYIEVNTQGNSIEVTTSNVKQYTLLLSPDEFDFNKEIVVITNGKQSFKNKIGKNPSTLLRWYKKDLDRTMLFGYELTIQVGN